MTTPTHQRRHQRDDEDPNVTEIVVDNRLAKHQNTNATPERNHISKNDHPAGNEFRRRMIINNSTNSTFSNTEFDRQSQHLLVITNDRRQYEIHEEIEQEEEEI